MVNLRRSLVINFFSSSGAALLQFIVSVLLARMLSPSEIGVYSMTVVFVNLAHVFRDFGVSTYLQRESVLTPDKIRSATGVVFTTSWLIATTMFLASGWIGRWFNEPEIVPVMQVLAIGFLFIPFGTVTNALLTREFAAEKQAIVMAVGTSSFCISCLVLAKLGFGSMSLAWANLINILACAIAYIPLRPKNMPWTPSFRHWRGVAHFGLGSLLTSCTVAINNAIPDILLGKLGSARLVGLLSRANSTVTIFTYVAGSTVNYGAVSYLAQTYHRGESLIPTMSRATALLTGVGWPALALTALLGHEIVLALYGATWLASVPAILPLTIAAAVGMTFNYIHPAIVAIGVENHADMSFKDTTRNVRDTEVFTVNMVDDALAHAMEICAIKFGPHIDELAEAGLTAVAGTQVASPRILEAPASLECKRYMTLSLGKAREIILGEVVGVFIRSDLVDDRLHIEQR